MTDKGRGLCKKHHEAEAQAHEARVRLEKIKKKTLLFKAGGIN